MSIHAPGNKTLALLDLEVLNLEKGKRAEWRSDEFEAVAVIIDGACGISSEGQAWELRRRSVFDEAASAVFVSPGAPLAIHATERTILALCKARAEKKFPTAFIPSENVSTEWRGEEGFRRRVSNIVNIGIQTQRIAVGETINEPGQWSSFPPHKHDRREESTGKIVEAPLEEIYYFRIKPETGFGFQRLYTKDGSFDESYLIKDGDVTRIPGGYHPVAGMPGHQLYYLWMLAGDERVYIWNTDPDFLWMEQTGKS